MAQRFEDLLVWQRARELTRVIYTLTGERRFSSDLALRDQLRRAAASIMANIAEGFERTSAREFGHFLAIAKGSCGEVRALLCVASDQEYLQRAAFEDAVAAAIEISKMLHALARSSP